MNFLNLFRANVSIPSKVQGYYVCLEKLSDKRKEERYAIIQGLINTLNSKGIDCATAPKDLTDYDIILLNPPAEAIELVKQIIRKYDPKLEKTIITDISVIKKAWQSRIRNHLIAKGYLRIGDQYITKEEIKSRSKFKHAFRVQASIHNGRLALYLDPKTKIMEPLPDHLIDRADELKEESGIRVRVLPRWNEGFLQGRDKGKAGDRLFPYMGKKLRGDEYWKVKHEIDFVNPEDELLKVYVPEYDKTGSYPRSCVFLEFKRGTSLPDNLKKSPAQRVNESIRFLKQIQPVTFLGLRLSFSITSVNEAGFEEYSFAPNVHVIVGGGKSVPISDVNKALKLHGPYAGTINGEYIVIYPDNVDLRTLRVAMSRIEKVYSSLKLGSLKASDIDGGFLCVEGSKVTDYSATILELRQRLRNKDVLAIVVLPDEYASEIYYESRSRLFERIFGLNPVKSQCILAETLDEILNPNTSYYVCANIASQCYVKLGGSGSAVWILSESADSPIRRISAGSSCYAYYDVSRRPKKKASASAYSALTDSYGRFIATGSKPVGGEGLTPSTFYDVLVEILQKVSMFNRMFGEVCEGRSFEFRRLVFAKDGVIRRNEARMMKEVILNGIPDEGKEPIKQLLEKSKLLPDQLVIDIISVNKSPNKRIFRYDGRSYRNVRQGTGISFDGKSGLLVSSSTHSGTVQPIELTLHDHICLNTDVPEPHISEIMDEYYRLSHLNWASLFKQGKYALPQILTQKLGENISAGLAIPDDLILL